MKKEIVYVTQSTGEQQKTALSSVENVIGSVLNAVDLQHLTVHHVLQTHIVTVMESASVTLTGQEICVKITLVFVISTAMDVMVQILINVPNVSLKRPLMK
jgi:hypothetical protein